MMRDLLAYGLTTTAVTPGASVFTQFAQIPQIVSRFVYPSGGGTLFITGNTGAAGVSGLAQVPVNGMMIWGPTQFWLLGAVQANVMTYLTQGYSGTPIATNVGYTTVP